ncbi:MAG: hypothetical protein HFJ24_09145 [Clostridia bacterium]|nr:hypothetical protein [Clostridia bacterium]
MALKQDGTVWAWGANNYGQLGNGTVATHYEPERVLDVGGKDYLSDVIDIACRKISCNSPKEKWRCYIMGAK